MNSTTTPKFASTNATSANANKRESSFVANAITLSTRFYWMYASGVSSKQTPKSAKTGLTTRTTEKAFLIKSSRSALISTKSANVVKME
jgi:uncharacterized protein YcfL